jgi:hypothetical protein
LRQKIFFACGRIKRRLKKTKVEGVTAIEAQIVPNVRPISDSLPSRIWFFSPIDFNSTEFLKLRRKVLERLAGRAGLEKKTIHFAIVDHSGGIDPEVNHLAALPNTVLVRTPERISADKSVVFGLRALRGTIREEDVVVTLSPKDNNHEKNLDLVLSSILDEIYDPKKIVLVEGRQNLFKPSAEIIANAGFRGWFVQFTLRKSEFDEGYVVGLKQSPHLKKLVSENTSFSGIENWLPFFKRGPLLLLRYGLPSSLALVVVLILLFALNTPVYAAFLGLILGN